MAAVCTSPAGNLKSRTGLEMAKRWTVCRVHGAGGGAPRGKAHPNYKHGLRSKQMEEVRQLVTIPRKVARDMG
jgi:hypothetical protein